MHQGSSNRHSVPAIVIGLDTLPGLQTARILAGHGIPVIAIASDPGHHCCRTRVCDAIHFANARSDEFLDKLVEIRNDLQERPVLVPCLDSAVLSISRHREHLEHDFRVVLPPAEVVELLTDKARFYTFAQDNGFAIPRTWILRQRSEVIAAVSDCRFPAVIKPCLRLPEWDRHTIFKAFKVHDADEALARYDECQDWADALILQQWIEGGDDSLYSCNTYFDSNSQPRASFVARKIRQWPHHIGFSSLGEECRDDFVLEQTIEMFRCAGFHGLGYVEFKRDTVSGECFIIEPNIGRPTGRSAIAEAGGVELLFTMYSDVLGLPLPEARVQTYGKAKWIDLRHDLQSAFSYWRKGELTLWQWWSSWRGKKAFAYFSLRDPAPFIHDLWRAAGKALLLWRAKKGRQ